jgi:hypothetical protein
LFRFSLARATAPADAPTREIPRQAVLLETLLRHPDDPFLEFFLPVVKPFPDGALLDAEEARRLAVGTRIEVAK